MTFVNHRHRLCPVPIIIIIIIPLRKTSDQKKNNFNKCLLNGEALNSFLCSMSKTDAQASEQQEHKRGKMLSHLKEHHAPFLHSGRRHEYYISIDGSHKREPIYEEKKCKVLLYSKEQVKEFLQKLNSSFSIYIIKFFPYLFHFIFCQIIAFVERKYMHLCSYCIHHHKRCVIFFIGFTYWRILFVVYLVGFVNDVTTFGHDCDR